MMYSNYGLQKRTGRRYKKKKNYRTTGSSTAKGLAVKALKEAKSIRKLISPEFKTVEAAVTTTYGNAWSLNLINGVSRGDDYDDRDGRQIKVKSIQCSFNVVRNASATVDQMVRIIVFIWRSPDGTAPTIDDVLEPGATAMVRLRSLNDRKNTRILYDKVVNLSTGNMTNVVLRYYKRIELTTIFNENTAGNIGDIDTNAIYVAIVSSDNTNQPTVNWTSRVRFIDN